MRLYRDVFGNPLKKDDVAMAVQAIVMNPTITAISLHRATRLGIGKSANILRLLEQAKVVTAAEDGTRQVILKGFNNHSAAINAAFRQLKKGRV